MKVHLGSAQSLSLLLPGIEHFRSGWKVRGTVALLTTCVPFWVGFSIVGHYLWSLGLGNPGGTLGEVLQRLPVAQWTEAFNFGNTLVAALLRPPSGPETHRLLQLPPDDPRWMHLGLFLSGASGVLAALWAADAHFLVRRTTTGMLPGTAAILTWILPGSGQWALGQRGKGLLVGGCVLVVFALGMCFAQGHAVDRQLHQYWWIGDVLFGGGTLLATLLTSPLRYEQVPPNYDLGLALCCVAGFMNLILMIDAYSIAEKQAGGEVAL
jgi:hypothetical protein